jgi:anti-anti-sigma regulatory factor
MDENDRVIGRFRATGIRPRFTERLKSYGIDLSHLLFSNLEQQGKAKPGAPWERK